MVSLHSFVAALALTLTLVPIPVPAVAALQAGRDFLWRPHSRGNDRIPARSEFFGVAIATPGSRSFGCSYRVLHS